MRMANDGDSSDEVAALRPVPGFFPAPLTTPLEVVEAQLAALRAGDMATVFRLFSRARRLAIQDGARRDVREFNLKEGAVYAALAGMLTGNCPGLVAHESHEVLASIGEPESLRAPGRLPTWICRIRVRSSSGVSRLFTITLTRQSGFDGGDARDQDGFEYCWFVWSIRPDDDGGGSAVVEREPVVV